MLRILIVDDEAAAGNILKLLIEKFIPTAKEICYCDAPEKALVLIKTFKPTLVMLDIEMSNMNGFDFLNQATGCDFDVIFTTAFDQYAIKAIRFSALDYLLKPIDNVELQNAINRHIVRQCIVGLILLADIFLSSQLSIKGIVLNAVLIVYISLKLETAKRVQVYKLKKL